MYGCVLDQGQILKLGLPPVSSAGSDAGFSGVSLVTSSVPACMSDSCVWADVTPIVSTILSTYPLRSAAMDAFHAGPLTSVIDLPGMYELIWYGPSEIVCWSSWRLFGT